MSKVKILVVDDDPDHLLICSLLLRRKGYDVSTLMTCDPFDDLTRAIDDFEPRLILMDHYMSGMTGFDVIKQLKADTRYAKIPIIYFSVHDRLDSLWSKAGANAFFKKPFNIDDLLAIVHRFVA